MLTMISGVGFMLLVICIFSFPFLRELLLKMALRFIFVHLPNLFFYMTEHK